MFPIKVQLISVKQNDTEDGTVFSFADIPLETALAIALDTFT